MKTILILTKVIIQFVKFFKKIYLASQYTLYIRTWIEMKIFQLILRIFCSYF